MDDKIYEYDKLVIGGSLASLIYAYHESLPIVWLDNRKPVYFEKTKGGILKLELWKSLCAIMSLSGLSIMGLNAASYREDGDILKVFGKEPYYIKFKANQYLYYDLSLDEKDNDPSTTYKVLDLMEFKHGTVHEYDSLSSDDNFIKDIIFYHTIRTVGGSRSLEGGRKKDAYSLSYLTKKELQQTEYSETYTRLKVKHMMKEAGIKGRKDGYLSRDKGKENPKPQYRSIELNVVDRQITMMDDIREEDLIYRYRKKLPENKNLLRSIERLGDPYGVSMKKQVVWEAGETSKWWK